MFGILFYSLTDYVEDVLHQEDLKKIYGDYHPDTSFHNNMNTTKQYEAIQQMGWYWRAKRVYSELLHGPKHWFCIVMSKGKTWIECIKCGFICKSEQNMEAECSDYVQITNIN